MAFIVSPFIPFLPVLPVLGKLLYDGIFSSSKYKNISAMKSLDSYGECISWESDPDASLALNELADISVYICFRTIGTGPTGGREHDNTGLLVIGGIINVPMGVTSDIFIHTFLLFQIDSGEYKDYGIAVELLECDGQVKFFFTDMYRRLNIPDDNKFFVCKSQTRLRFLVNFCVPSNDEVGKAQKGWFGESYKTLGKNCKGWAHLMAQSIKGEKIEVQGDLLDSWGTSEKFVQYWCDDNDCRTFYKCGQDFSAGRAGKNAQKVYDQANK